MRKTLIRSLIVLILLPPLSEAADLYVSSYTEGQIVKVSQSGNISGFTSTFMPKGLAFGNDGYLYAGSGIDIVKIDSLGNKITFVSSLSVRGLAFGPSGYLYAIDGGTDATIFKIDTFGNYEVFADGIEYGTDIAFDSNGYLYAANGVNGGIYKIDSLGNKSILVPTSTIGTRGIAIGPDGYLYASGYSDTIAKIDTANGSYVTFTQSSLLENPGALAFDSAGYLYVANATPGTIVKVNSLGNVSDFASGIMSPISIAIPVPEPSSYAVGGISALAMLAIGLWRRRSA